MEEDFQEETKKSRAPSLVIKIIRTILAIIEFLFGIGALLIAILTFLDQSIDWQSVIFIVLGIVLIIIANGLRRSKKWAWIVSAILFLLFLVFWILISTGLWSVTSHKIGCIRSPLDKYSSETFTLDQRLQERFKKPEKITINKVSIPLSECEACELALQVWKGCSCEAVLSYGLVICGRVSGHPTGGGYEGIEINEIDKTIMYGGGGM